MTGDGVQAHASVGATDVSSAVQACFGAALDEIRMLERSLEVVLERERRLAARLAGVEGDRDRVAEELARLRAEVGARPGTVAAPAIEAAAPPSIVWRALEDAPAFAEGEGAAPLPSFADRAFWPDQGPSRRRSFLRLLGTTAVQAAVTVAAMAGLLAAIG